MPSSKWNNTKIGSDYSIRGRERKKNIVSTRTFVVRLLKWLIKRVYLEVLVLPLSLKIHYIRCVPRTVGKYPGTHTDTLAVFNYYPCFTRCARLKAITFRKRWCVGNLVE